MRKGTREALALIVAGLWVFSGLNISPLAASAPQKVPPYYVFTIAASARNQFVGAVDSESSLFVGFLNGTVVRMDPITGTMTGKLFLPDGNSAAHLAYYNGSVFVGTEYLRGARNDPPYHVYKIDSASMKITGQVEMRAPFANGFVVPLDGFVWAADGHCTLYKIDPATMQVKGTLTGVAEDEMASDGVRYWAECRDMVKVLSPGTGLPTVVAAGSLEFPNRPRGFFIVNSSVYSSGTEDYALYSMKLFGNFVLLQHAGMLGNQSHPTRDTLVSKGLIYAYQTGRDAETGKLTAQIYIFSHHFRLKAVVRLPGRALCADASQHTLFLHKGTLYFVTRSAVGFITKRPGLNVTGPGPYQVGLGGPFSLGERSWPLSSTGFIGLMHAPVHHWRSRQLA